MDDSWRFRPVQNHVCPVCSIPHFPLCPMPPLPPPPHAFDRYRPTAADFHHIPPGFHPPFSHGPPFWEHRPMLPPMPFPSEPWGVNHAPGREPFLSAVHPPKRFVQDEFSGGGIYKRMRVEDSPTGAIHLPHFDRQEFVPGRISGDDERRLNLIRDHGQQNMSEGLPQSNGELLPNRIACDGTQNQYRDGERSGLTLPPESTFGPPKQFLRPNGYMDQDFPGATSSRGVERFVAGERLELERTCAYDTRTGEHRNAHYGRKEFGGDSEDGDRPIVTQRHSDVSFQQYDSYRDGGSNSEYNAAHGTQELPFPVKGQQTAYPMPDYAPLGPLRQLDHHNRHDFRELHLPKESPYVQAKVHYTDPGSCRLGRDTDGNGKNSSYPSSESFTEHRYEIPSKQAGTNRVPFEAKHQEFNDTHRQLKSVNYSFVEESNAKNYALHGGFPPMPNTNTPAVYPALPPQALPAGHLDPSLKHVPVTSSSSGAPPQPLFPVLSSASAMASIPSNKTYSDPHALQQSSGYTEQFPYPSELSTEDFDLTHQAPSKPYLEGVPKVPMEHPMKTKPTIVDACDLFKQPRRASRPNHIVIILRGLPGSGKSYLAKALRDLEIENGGNAPRIHAMDDYFMVEVEKKVDDNEGSKSSSLSRVKKQITKKVIEYCYEPEMEEAYRSSMLKAFKKTLEEGIFTFIIVDDRNLRVADFAQFWAIAKRSGYEVYLLEAPYKDPTGCAARNVHGFALEDIQNMAEKWEEAPPLYLQLDIQLLFRGDDLNEHSIQEVDMDINDSDCDDDNSTLRDEENVKPPASESVDYVPDQDSLEVGEKWDSEEDDEDQTRINKLGSSKWSKDLDDENEKLKGDERKINALSGLIQVYSKGGKSVHWGDQVDKSGFSIGAVKKQNSLIIGPGSGYNLASNPLVENQDDADAIEISSMSESKKRFSEKLRAEHESLRLVLNKRRQRIGGLFSTEDE